MMTLAMSRLPPNRFFSIARRRAPASFRNSPMLRHPRSVRVADLGVHRESLAAAREAEAAAAHEPGGGARAQPAAAGQRGMRQRAAEVMKPLPRREEWIRAPVDRHT